MIMFIKKSILSFKESYKNYYNLKKKTKLKVSLAKQLKKSLIIFKRKS